MPVSPNARQRVTSARESAIVRAIIARLNAIPGCLARKRHGNAYSVAGDPDITGCYYGRHFELEVKRPDGRLTALQEQRLAEWTRAGARVAVVTTVEDAVAVVTTGIRDAWGGRDA